MRHAAPRYLPAPPVAGGAAAPPAAAVAPIPPAARPAWMAVTADPQRESRPKDGGGGDAAASRSVVAPGLCPAFAVQTHRHSDA
eukprot:gene20258-28484_t